MRKQKLVISEIPCMGCGLLSLKVGNDVWHKYGVYCPKCGFSHGAKTQAKCLRFAADPNRRSWCSRKTIADREKALQQQHRDVEKE